MPRATFAPVTYPWLILAGVIAAWALAELMLAGRPARIAALHSGGKLDQRTAGISVALWVLVAAAMAMVVTLMYSHGFKGVNDALLLDPVRSVRPSAEDALLQFLTVYVTELALSVDNLALWALLFSWYRIDPARQSRILFYGLAVSLAMRFGLIWGSARLWHLYESMSHVFAAVLGLAMVRTLVMPDWSTNFEQRPHVRVLSWMLGVGPAGGAGVGMMAPDYGARAEQKGRLVLLLVVLSGAADLTYAVDSIPAAFAITRDPFIAFAASACVILMLRSLHLALGGVVRAFRFMKLALLAVLGYFVVKLWILPRTDVPTWLTLAVVTAVFVFFGVLSWMHYRSLGFAPVVPERPAPVADMAEAIAATRRNLRKVFILIAGTLLMCSAAVIGPLPGPGGSIVFFAGLGLLATEFVWARKLLIQLKAQAEKMGERTDTITAKTGVWPVPILMALYVAVGWVVVRYGIIPYEFALAVIGGAAFPVALLLARMITGWWLSRKSSTQPAAPPTP